MNIVVKTCLNLTKNITVEYEVTGTSYEIDSERGISLEFPEGAKIVYFQGNYSKSEFLDKVEELTDKLSNYHVIIDGEDVTHQF